MADSKQIKEAAEALGIANDKLESFSSTIKKLIQEELEGFKKVNNQLSSGKDLVTELAKSYGDIKDVISGMDLSRTITQENELLGKLNEKKILEDKISETLNEYIKNKKEYGELEEKLSSVAEEHADYYGESIYRLADMQKELKQNLKTLIASYDEMIRQNRALEEQKRLLQDIKITIENTFGFGQFKGLFGILGKLPSVEKAFENMSLSTMVFLGLATMYLKYVFSTIYKAFDDVNGAFVKTAKSFGLLKNEAGIFKDFIYNTTTELTKYGATAEEVATTVTNMVDSFGSLTLFNEKAAADITLISKQLGVGNKELTDGVMTLMSFGKIDMVKSTKVVYFASALSKAAGVPLAKVMDDVAKAGDKARGMIKGGAEQLIKAATYARRLGTDLEKVAEVGRKMLDFQESITDEIEASVLLGSNISFQKARELFYTNRIQEGYDEIFKVVKSIGDFNKLDIFQKEQIAKATGLSLTDLQKQAQIREDLALIETSGTEQQKKMVEEYKKLTNQSGQILENTADAAAQRTKDIINLKETEEITARIKGLFYSIASYILPAIEKILGGINSILSVLDTTGGKIFFGFVTLASTVAAVVLSFKALYALYKDLRNIRAIIQGITAAQAAQNLAVQGEVIAQGELAAARGAANAANVGGGFMSSLTAINPGQILASAAAIAIVAGSFVLLAYGLKQFSDIKLEDVGLGLLSLAGLIGLTSVAIAAMSEVILPATGIIGLFAGAILLLSGAVIAVGYGMKLFGDGLKNVGDGLKSAVQALKEFKENVGFFGSIKLASVFYSINKSINNFDLNKLKSIISSIQSLTSSLNSVSNLSAMPQITFLTNAIDSLKEFNSIKLSDVFSEMNQSLNSFNLDRLQSIVSVMQSLASVLNSISAFKGIPQLTLPTNTVNTTNTPTVLTNAPVLSPIQTNPPATNAVINTTNPTAMIDSIRQGIREGFRGATLNVYLDGSSILVGINKNVAFREDTGGVAMQTSLA